MTDEEKNVIDLLKNIDKQKCLMLNCPVVKNNIERQLKIIELNRIIRKQSKEIEELKDKFSDEKIRNIVIKRYREVIEKDYISKDKIKAKIKEYEQDVKDFEEYWSKDPRKFKKEKSVDYYKLEALKELLEKE